MNSHSHDCVDVLLRCGALTSHQVVNDVIMLETRRRERSLSTTVSSNGRREYQVKKALPGHGEWLVKEIELCQYLEGKLNDAPIMPRYIHGDRDSLFLVTEYVADATTLHERSYLGEGVRADDFKAVGRLLGELHAASRGTVLTPPLDVPWVFSLFTSGEEGARAMCKQLSCWLTHADDYQVVSQGVTAAGADWNPDCIIHGDVKLDNFLFRPGPVDRHEHRLVLLDWELGGFGDSTWDLAGALAEVLVFACQAEDRVSSGSLVPGARLVRPAAEALLQSYWDTTRAATINRPSPDQVIVCAGFTAARLVQAAVEIGTYQDAQSGQAASIIATAKAIIVDPRSFSDRYFGYTG